MGAGSVHFEELLKRLEEARLADEKLHRRNASLAERVTSHDRLAKLRAEIAEARSTTGHNPMETLGLHDSRAGRGIGSVTDLSV